MRVNITVPDEMLPYKDDLEFLLHGMLTKLKANMHKSSTEYTVDELMRLLDQEVEELRDAVDSGNYENTLCEVYDVLNYLLLLASCLRSGKNYPFASRAKNGAPLEFVHWALRQNTDECIVWPYNVNKNPLFGYPRLCRGQSPYGRQVNRVVCHEAYGAPPSNRHVAAHSCNNRLCINPRHLRWATPEENSADKRVHGTASTPVKLSKKDVAAIRERRRKGELVADLAGEYGISKTGLILASRGTTHFDVAEPLVGRCHGNYGERDGSAKLTAAQAYEIKNSEDKAKNLAIRFGVSTALIRMIRRGELWVRAIKEYEYKRLQAHNKETTT